MATAASAGRLADAPPRGVDLAVDHKKVDPDDDDEWEYEYSATETETYYLTVDLSIPEWVYRNPMGIIHPGRGGYYAEQINDTELEQRRSIAKLVVPPGADLEDDDDEPLPEPEDDLIGDSDWDVPPNGKDGEGEPAPEGWNSGFDDKLVERDLEILDLHTPHPIISYRGKVFEGSWAEVIGTEMIFMARDEIDPLPALRHLPGEVDLLAAATARIQTKEKSLRPTEEHDRYKEIKEKQGIRVGVSSKYRNEERLQQAKFLENLWAVKTKKGEKDMPTITAKPPADKNFDDNKDPDKTTRKRRAGRRPRGGAAVKAAAAAAAEAQARLQAASLAVPEARKPGQRKPLPFSRPDEPAATDVGGQSRSPTPSRPMPMYPSPEVDTEGEDGDTQMGG